MRPNCTLCGNPAHNQDKNKDGSIRWRKIPKELSKETGKSGYICGDCHTDYLTKKNGCDNKSQFINSMHPYRKFRKTYCENVDGRLGFKCTTNIQGDFMLDVDHIDGNPYNNIESNLQTLCKCCHSYKTLGSKDYATPGRKIKILKGKTEMKEMNKNELYLKSVGARPMQIDWIENVVMRKQDNKFAIIDAQTGAGKTFGKKLFLSHISNLDTEKTLTILSVPQTSQSITQNMLRDIYTEVSTDTAILVVGNAGNTSSTNALEFNEKNLKFVDKRYNHIIVLTTHSFLRKVHTDLNIIVDRNKRLLIDEAHKELHTDGKHHYVENTENPEASYSDLGINIIKIMIEKDYVVTGFTGTSSKQQRKDIFGANDIFDFYELKSEYRDSVLMNNTYLDDVRYGADHIAFGSYRRQNLEYYQCIDRYATIFNEDVLNREGVSLMFLAPAFGSFNRFGKKGYLDQQAALDIIKASDLTHDQVLYWFGGNEKYTYIDAEGKRRKNYNYYTPEQVLKINPKIKLVLVKELIKEGVDFHNFNHILFGRPENKTNEHMTNEQRIGRGVRKGDTGLKLTFFATESDFENEKHLVERVLERGTITTKDKWMTLQYASA